MVVSADRPGAQTGDGENIILGRPTDDSIVVHVLAEQGTQVSVEYGDSPGRFSERTEPIAASADGTAVITVDGLDPGSVYRYRVTYTDANGSRNGEEYSFRTQRSRGTPFSFGVQGDSHPERRTRMYHPDLYARTMQLVAGAQPDLYFMLGDYFAFEWGDAQYEWFKKTLEESDAKYKFVFTHHVLGTGRGGIERETRYEWGGYTDEGVWEFDEQRPDWDLPIHQLMVENGVTIFFQAHDHIFARQELDGVVYQSVPNPADDTYEGRNKNAYLSGDILDSSGYLHVTVMPAGQGVQS